MRRLLLGVEAAALLVVLWLRWRALQGQVIHEYLLEFQSTPVEHYDTDMVDRVRAVLTGEARVTMLAEEGGTGFGPDGDHYSDNVWLVSARDKDVVHRLARLVEAEVGHDVEVNRL